MSQLELLMTKLDDSVQEQTDDEIHAVLAEVPWARKSLQTYLTSQQPELRQDLLALIGERLLITA